MVVSSVNRFFPRVQEFFRGYRIYFWRPVHVFEKNRIEVLKMPEIMEFSGFEEAPVDCGVYTDGEALQDFMDQLWTLGFRPKEGHGSTGQIAAVEKHLESVEKTHDRLLVMIEKKWERKDE